ncbi:type II CAAX prenyl endopeptidase Rce1 family protein [Rubrivirga sp.]|uniref:CPBP family glutamic-type intramembrane protease n=1 Tax=Rubrivirga sp. TaxID=1885344 RepID=UPI003C747331
MPDPTSPLTSTRPPSEPGSDLEGGRIDVAGDESAIVDAWPWATPSRLTGWFERNGFTPILTALLVFVVAFVLFQVVIAPIVIGIGIAIDFARNGETAPPDMGSVMEMVMENGQLLMTANTVGQILGFAVLALVVARLHTPDVREYLRIRRADASALGLAALGWACLYPAVIWTGQLNGSIPLPEWLESLEQGQIDMIEGLLMGDSLSTGFLFIALALTPSVCEELLFRGYLQRQVERSWGTIMSIVLVGIFFGLYHLRLSQAIPLSLLGIYLGFVVWATGSLWSGFLVHLLNNGLAVVATSVARNDPDLDLELIEAMGMPWYLGVAGLVLCIGVSRVLAARRRAVAGDTPDAHPVRAIPLSTPHPTLS